MIKIYANVFEQQKAYRKNNKEKIKAKSKAARIKKNKAKKQPTLIHKYEPPDKLVGTINIVITPEQREFLKQNKLELRTKLYKMFNLRFRTTYSKMQITRSLETLDTAITKPKRRKAQ